MKNKNQDSLTILIITAVIVSILSPFLFFWTGYLDGWIATKIIGKYIIEFLTIFNLDIPLEKIPIIIGVLNSIIHIFIPIKIKDYK